MSVGETGPIFTGDFKVSQNQGVTTFVGYLGSYKGEGDLPKKFEGRLDAVTDGSLAVAVGEKTYTLERKNISKIRIDLI